MDFPKVYDAKNCSPCEKCFSRLACRALYAELASEFCVNMLEKTGTPSGGQPTPVVGSQFGEE